jgi:hypothetical protein
MPGQEHRLDIAKYTVRAIEFACKYELKYIVACNIMSPTIGGLNIVTSLAMDDTDYVENLDGCLSTLEDNEEYELCAKVLELKKLDFDFKNERYINESKIYDAKFLKEFSFTEDKKSLLSSIGKYINS